MDIGHPPPHISGLNLELSETEFIRIEDFTRLPWDLRSEEWEWSLMLNICPLEIIDR